MTKEYPWMLGPFEKAAEANPCLVPNAVSRFFCPVQEKELGWEAKDVFNPAAVVKDDRVYLLYRAEDHEGKKLYPVSASLYVKKLGDRKRACQTERLCFYLTEHNVTQGYHALVGYVRRSEGFLCVSRVGNKHSRASLFA